MIVRVEIESNELSWVWAKKYRIWNANQ